MKVKEWPTIHKQRFSARVKYKKEIQRESGVNIILYFQSN